MQTFSIIIPVHNRADSIARAIESILDQGYPKELFEIIIVDDGSTDETSTIVTNMCEANRELGFDIFKIVFPENKGRLVARNHGMSWATKDWICWLDSDDEYSSNYLKVLNDAIEKYPGYGIFNFGAIVYDEQNFRSYLRDTFMPELREDGRGHVPFKSGGIGSGSFIFRRELLQSVGFLPEASTPYGDDSSLPALATTRWPDLRSLYGQSDSGQWLPFGNPWGDDWLMFYLLTRNNESKPLDIHLYIQHLRR